MGNPNVIMKELDRLYSINSEKYSVECEQLKRIGYKIYRNSHGEHKVVEPVKPTTTNKLNYGNVLDFFNGLF